MLEFNAPTPVKTELGDGMAIYAVYSGMELFGTSGQIKLEWRTTPLGTSGISLQSNFIV